MTWGALKADGRMAAKSALKIRAALAQTAEFKRVYENYLRTQPNLSDKPAQDRARARAWVMLNIRVNMMALMGVLERVYAEGWVTGEAAANEAIAKAKEARKAADDDLIDWSTWEPGDQAAALLLRPTKAFQQFLGSFGITLKDLTNTTVNDIGNSLADALGQGLSANQAAKLIRQNVATSSRALTIAITEQNRAMSAATINRYKEMQIPQMEWEVSDPCPKCAINANQVVRIGEAFNSGDTQPPAHPNCRCALLPVIPDFGSDIFDTQGEILPGPEQTDLVEVDPFRKAGGEVSRPLRLADDAVKEAEATLEAMADLLGEDWDKSLGVEFTKFALLQPSLVNGTRQVRLAQLPEGLGGAISYLVRGVDDILDAGTMGAFENFVDAAPHLYIEYLGSTGIVPRTGTSLAQTVIKEAADNNLGIILESATPQSSDFWRKMGLNPLSAEEGEAFYGLTAQEVVALVEKMKP
jgi:SPP1 gp7 family putative phage head morphogenesis protein